MEDKATSKEQEVRLKKAAENLKAIQESLTPYIKPRKIINTNTQGQWKKASNGEVTLPQETLQNVLRGIKHITSGQVNTTSQW